MSCQWLILWLNKGFWDKLLTSHETLIISIDNCSIKWSISTLKKVPLSFIVPLRGKEEWKQSIRQLLPKNSNSLYKRIFPMSKMTLIHHKDHQKDPTKAKMCQTQALFSNCLMRQNDSKLNVWPFLKQSMHMLD